jgi:hypothetical protein
LAKIEEIDEVRSVRAAADLKILVLTNPRSYSRERPKLVQLLARAPVVKVRQTHDGREYSVVAFVVDGSGAFAVYQHCSGSMKLVVQGFAADIEKNVIKSFVEEAQGLEPYSETDLCRPRYV